MSLATRCTSCGTVFRVVQDQLKVSEGWVRCGRCDAVFNALEGLFDLGREAATAWDAGPAPSPVDAPAPAIAPALVPVPTGFVASTLDEDRTPSSSFPSTAPAALDALLAADPIDAHLFRKRGGETDKHVAARDRLEFSDARFDSDLFADNAAAGEVDLAEPMPSGAGDLPLESAHAQPDFIRRAERRARWRSGPVRLALAVGCVLGLATLALQAGHQFRDPIAADWPALRPALAAWCRAVDCAIEPPRRIDELLVDSTALTRAIGLDAFVLSVTLKNRSRVALAMPSVDLSLTDGNGRLIARRALGPRDFRAAAVIGAGAEAPLQLMLNAGSARVAGYTVEIFYP